MLDGRGRKAASAAMPKGLYMYGGVGVGKTMLMDLLVKSAPSQFQACRAPSAHGRLTDLLLAGVTMLECSQHILCCVHDYSP